MTNHVTFLGTGAMQPSKRRNHSGIHVRLGCDFLFDCGESTQKQLRIAGYKPSKLKHIFITHFHGDHVLGLGGMLCAIQNDGLDKINLFGPKGTKKYIKHLLKSFAYKELPKITIYEGPKSWEIEGLIIESIAMEHSVPCLAYRISTPPKFKLDKNKIKGLPIEIIKKLSNQEKVKFGDTNYFPENYGKINEGKSVTYVTDTKTNKNIDKISKCDLLIIESTFENGLEDLAEKSYHMTVNQALSHGKNSKKVVLTHLSQRYKDGDIIFKQANGKALIAQDLLRINF